MRLSDDVLLGIEGTPAGKQWRNSRRGRGQRFVRSGPGGLVSYYAGMPRVWAFALDALAMLWGLTPGEAIIRLMLQHPDVRAVEMVRYEARNLMEKGRRTDGNANRTESHAQGRTTQRRTAADSAGSQSRRAR